MRVAKILENLAQCGPAFRDAALTRNWKVLAGLLGPAFRGLVLQRAKHEPITHMDVDYPVAFDWNYTRDFPEMARLYEAAKKSQWNASTDLDWFMTVDPFRADRQLFPENLIPVRGLPVWKKMSNHEHQEQQYFMLAWLLSQFLHGEQGALFAAAQVTEAVPWLDGKLYGSTQVVDEGRHVEAFHTYLSSKLEKLYQINDNLYVVIDNLMSDSRWDMKFLGMQIMIEGLALGAFSTFRAITEEPLLKDLLKYVITDEARHVHYGVLALTKYINEELSDSERREREDWAFEISLLLRNRFLAHEIYEESYAHIMSRRAWNDLVMKSDLMALFRRTMFRRIIPNLRRIGLLSERVKPFYDQIGLLQFENEKDAMQLSPEDLLDAG